MHCGVAPWVLDESIRDGGVDLAIGGAVAQELGDCREREPDSGRRPRSPSAARLFLEVPFVANEVQTVHCAPVDPLLIRSVQ